MVRWVMLAAVAALTGCDDKRPPPSPTEPIVEAARVRLVVVAPDGVRLWRVYDSDRAQWVYFAGSGASWTESCGKSCTRRVDVPKGEPTHD